MSLLNVGARALMANQLALQTAGNNIANVNTAGYSRQTVAFQTAVGQNMGNGYIGNGADVATVMRNFSELQKAGYATDPAYAQKLSRAIQSVQQVNVAAANHNVNSAAQVASRAMGGVAIGGNRAAPINKINENQS